LPALAASLLVGIWAVPFLPTHDGPKTLYAAHVWSHANEPAFSSDFTRGAALTNLGFSAVYAAAERVFGWRIAYALAISAVVLALPAAMYRLGRALHPARAAPAAIAGAASALGWSVTMGFFNYSASVALGLLTIGVAIEAVTWSARRKLAILGLLTVTTLFHPFGAQLACVAIATFRLLEARRGRIIVDLGSAALMCTPVLAVTIAANEAKEEAQREGTLVRLALDLAPAERLETLSSCFLPGPLWRAAPIVALAAVGAGVATFDPLRRRFRPAALAVLAVAAVGLAGFLVTPMHSRVWEFLQPRFIPPMLLAAIALVPFERVGGGARAWLLVALSSSALSSNAVEAARSLRFARAEEDALGGLGAAVPPGRTLLPIVARTDAGHGTNRPGFSPEPRPLLNLGQIYATDRDAVTPYAFALLKNIHLVESTSARMRRVPKRDYGAAFADDADPSFRRSELVRLASYGLSYDDVLFLGAVEDADAFVALGYEVETRRGGFVIGAFRGCRVDVRVEGRVPKGWLHVGWVPSDRITDSFELEPAADNRFTIPRASCRGVWAMVAPDAGGAAARCRGGRADGAAEGAAGQAEVICAIEP
jgi:hypothetical protein